MEEPAPYKLGRKVTVAEFQRLDREGFFPFEARLELIDGEVREMAPIGPSHAWIVDRLAEELILKLADTFRIRGQNPIVLDSRNQPQPDIVVARRNSAFKLRHPLPPDVLLAIEVSDSSLREDRRHKIPRYARAGIPESWIVDVGRERIRAFTQPVGITYLSETTFTRGEAIRCTSIPDLQLKVDQAFDD